MQVLYTVDYPPFSTLSARPNCTWNLSSWLHLTPFESPLCGEQHVGQDVNATVECLSDHLGSGAVSDLHVLLFLVPGLPGCLRSTSDPGTFRL